jgi:hypothetical protein
MRIYFHLPYRQTEGIIKATGKNLPDHPLVIHTDLQKKSKNKLEITSNRLDDDDDDGIIIAIDSTGIKVTNRGPQWIQEEKWHLKKKGYIKIHVAVEISRPKKYTCFRSYNWWKSTCDGKIMPKLIEQILENSNNIKIKSVSCDGSYDSNENFKYLQNKRIRPAAIKVRKNSLSFLPKTIMQGIKRSQVSNKRDILKWKKKRKYGKRWIADEMLCCMIRKTVKTASLS